MILRYFLGGNTTGGGGGGSLAVTFDTYEILETDLTPPGTLSATCTATASGGTAPYTYAWSLVPGSGSTAGMSITGTATATVTFQWTNGSADTRSFVYKCTATDSAATTAVNDVSVYFIFGAPP